MVQPLQQAFVHEGIEEIHFLRRALHHIGNDVLDHVLCQRHIVTQISQNSAACRVVLEFSARKVGPKV